MMLLADRHDVIRQPGAVQFVFDTDHRLICTATIAQTFSFFGEEGARVQSERAKLLTRHVRDLRANTVRLDLELAMQRRTELADAALEVPRGPRVTLTASMKSMLQAVNAQQRAQAQQAVRRSTPYSPLGTVPLSSPPITSQWQTPPNAWLSEQTGLREVRYDDDVHIDADVDDTLPFQSGADQ